MNQKERLETVRQAVEKLEHALGVMGSGLATLDGALERFDALPLECKVALLSRVVSDGASSLEWLQMLANAIRTELDVLDREAA